MARDTVNARIPESAIQEAAVIELESYLRRHPGAFAFAAGLEGVPMTPRKRAAMRAQGMSPGEPDLRFYLPRGRTLLIELKADGGTRNAAQKARHAALGALGFEVLTQRYTTREEAAKGVLATVLGRL